MNFKKEYQVFLEQGTEALYSLLKEEQINLEQSVNNLLKKIYLANVLDLVKYLKNNYKKIHKEVSEIEISGHCNNLKIYYSSEEYDRLDIKSKNKILDRKIINVVESCKEVSYINEELKNRSVHILVSEDFDETFFDLLLNAEFKKIIFSSQLDSTLSNDKNGSIKTKI